MYLGASGNVSFSWENDDEHVRARYLFLGMATQSAMNFYELS